MVTKTERERRAKTRLHTLITAYRQYKDECQRTGNGTPSKKPPFFNGLEEILSDKPSTKPKYVINSTKIDVESCCKDNIEETEETGDGGEGIKLQQENIEPNIPSSSSSCEVAVTAPKCTQEVCVKGKPHNIL